MRARKYVWWQPPQQTLAEPALLVAQIMTLGILEDVQWLLGRVSRDAPRGVLCGSGSLTEQNMSA